MGPEPQNDPGTASPLLAASALADAIGQLVEDAAQGDIELLERRLLRTLVELDLAPAASLWRRPPAEGPGNGLPIRSFGGTTPPPAEGFTTPVARSYPLDDDRCVVAARCTYRADRDEEHIEEKIDALVALAVTLSEACPIRQAIAGSPVVGRRQGDDDAGE
ncbi:MAG: hypothetical protein AAGB93_10600 [Planctomycetota bacterium]